MQEGVAEALILGAMGAILTSTLVTSAACDKSTGKRIAVGTSLGLVAMVALTGATYVAIVLRMPTE